jgi:predicted solute-binding protein
MEKILVLVFALFISFNANSKEKNLIDKLYYTGFSFSGYYKDKAYASKYFSELGDKKIVNLFFEIANNLEPVHFKIIADQKSNKLLELQNENANFLAFVINHEDFAEEHSDNTGIYVGFYEAYFQIIVYDSYNKNLVTSRSN